MEAFQSELSKVWKKVHESKEISEHIANDFEEFIVEEEFDYIALIDDINDKEDESSIGLWLKNNKYNNHNEFEILQKIINNIGPQSYYGSNNNKLSEEEIKISYYDSDDNKDDNKNNEPQLDWNGLPQKIIIKHITKNNTNENNNISSKDNKSLNKSNGNIKEILSELNKEFDFKSNPSITSEIINILTTEYSANISSVIENNKQEEKNDNNNDDNNNGVIGVSGNDLSTIKSALSRLNLYSFDELNEFVRFCVDEEYGEDQLIDDIEVFEEGDSAIIENMASIFNWNSLKAQKFVNNLRSILGITNIQLTQTKRQSYHKLNTNITPGGGNNNNNNNNNTYITPGGKSVIDNKFTISEINALPSLPLFIIPASIMKKKIGRSVEDIEDCLRRNNINNKIINIYSTFCEEEKCDEEFMAFNEIEHGMKLKTEYPSIGYKLAQYILKCQYELYIPQFKPSTFTKKDETNFSQYMERECPGIIKHDRDLLRYFLLTRETEPDLSSLLIDIVDRISVNDLHPLDLKTFTNKSFFKQLNKSQTSIIKNGLRTYHNRFFPRLTMNPLSLICDKISDYQKYTCILSQYISQIIDLKLIQAPILIDFMIIPPGVYNKILNNFTAEKCMNLGDIKQHLNDFENETYTNIAGLNANGNDNFNMNIMNNIVNNMIEATKKLIKSIGNKKKYQRIVIAIDRRWRILNRKHCIYNKLRSVHTNEIYDHKIINKDTYDYKEYENDNGLTNDTGFEECDVNVDDYDDDDDDNDISGGLFGSKSIPIDFNNKLYQTYIENEIKCDNIFIYQPKTPHKSRKINEFNEKFCHETLMYLTKQCILPRRKITMQKYRNINGKMNNNNNKNKNKYHIDSDDDDDEYCGLIHLSGDSADGYMFNLSVHIYNPYPNNIWYKYKLKWYLFTQSASIRIHQDDFNTFWFKYFVDPEKDIHKLNKNELKKYFKFDLFEVDVGFKRWYHAIKRTIN